MKPNNIQASTITTQGRTIEKYLLKKALGQGQFGKVFKAEHLETHQIFAIKQIDKRKINANPILKRLLDTEVSIMHEINHPNILHMHDYLETEKNYYLVIDFCNEGDFENYLEKRKLKFLPEEKAVFFLKQIMNGFTKLREHKVLHRDFKLANLFVNDETLVIGDFGFAKSGNDLAQTRLGTPLTMAYEIITAPNTEEITYTSKADLWSVGIVYYQMLFGKTPFFGATMPQLIRDIKAKVNKLTFPKPVSAESKDLIQRLLQPNPDKRIDWKDFFGHPLFKKFDDPMNQQDLKKIGGILQSKMVNDQFQKNIRKLLQKIQNSKGQNTFMNQNDLQKYVPKIQAKHVDRIHKLNNQTFQKYNQNEMLQNVLHRYNHEKNIVNFHIVVCKLIQSFLKSNSDPSVKKQLLELSVLLIKKAHLTNSEIITSLQQGTNRFHIPNNAFSQALGSGMKSQILSVFQLNEDQFQSYLQLLLERAKDLGVTLDYNIRTLSNQQHLSPNFNNFILQIRKALMPFTQRSFGHLTKLFLQAIYGSFYCAYSQQYMAFETFQFSQRN
jgi:serine/threonine protein kinase